MKTIVVIALFFVALSSCKKENTEPEVSSQKIIISTNSQFGQIITDEDGHALYFFSDDANGNSSCVDDCIDKWPAFYAENIELSIGLEKSDFGEIKRADGNMQTTYKSWPLYYFSPNSDGKPEEAGLVSCDGANGTWFVAKPDYSIMIAHAQLIGEDGVKYKSDYTEGEELSFYFTDAYGNTLYRFVNDKYNTNNYTANDFSNNDLWPIFYTDILSFPSTLNNADFAMIDVFGKKQLTYKGNPLYYFSQDLNRGDNKGVSFPSPGVWPIVNTSTVDAPTP